MNMSDIIEKLLLDIKNFEEGIERKKTNISNLEQNKEEILKQIEYNK